MKKPAEGTVSCTDPKGTLGISSGSSQYQTLVKQMVMVYRNPPTTDGMPCMPNGALKISKACACPSQICPENSYCYNADSDNMLGRC